MNTENLKTRQPIHAPMDRFEAILHERLALQRIKELARPESPAMRTAARDWHDALQAALDSALSLLEALFRRPKLMREIAPGQPPVEWHETERARALRALQLL